MTKLIKKITSVIATLSIMATMITVPASAATTVEAPVASKKSGTYYMTVCDCTTSEPGLHYYYSVYGEKKAIAPSYPCEGGSSACTINLSSNTKGATIYFDIEYTTLTKNYANAGYFVDTKETGLKYSKPIPLDCDTKITAYAVKNGVKSKSVTYEYKIREKPVFSPDEGIYDEAVSVQIATENGMVDGSIYYTTDGTKPTTSSAKPVSRAGGYFGFEYPYIDIDKSCTLRLLIVPSKSSGRSSYYLTKKYVIKNGASESDTQPYEDKYYYNNLSSAQKKAYASVYKSATLGLNGSISGYGLKGQENAEVREAFFYENPEFPIEGMKQTSTTLYTATTKAMRQKLESSTADLIKEAKKLKTDYDRIKYFHDEIIKMAKFGMNKTNHQNAYGIFVEKQAACQGYSNAFAYLCQKMDIPCVIVHGTGKKEAHAWNMVKLDGNWYHVDLLWDDPTGANIVRYNYFLVSDSTIKKDHTIEMKIDIPSAPKDYDKKHTSSSTDTKDETTSTTKTSAITTRALVRNKCILDEGAKVKLTYLFSKTDGVTFKSSNKSVAKITKSTSTGTYYVKGVKEGEATITATYKGDTATLKVYVTNVKDTTSTLKVNANKSVKVGSIIKVSAVIDKGSDEYITWMTTSNKYLKVDSYSLDGEYVKFKALKKGTAKVYAITSSGKVKSITITIK